MRLSNALYLKSHGYKVYSQNDEDSIIEEIFNRIETTYKIFIEFGVQNGLESIVIISFTVETMNREHH